MIVFSVGQLDQKLATFANCCTVTAYITLVSIQYMFVFKVIKTLFHKPRQSVEVIMSTEITASVAAMLFVGSFVLTEFLFRVVHLLPGYDLLDGGMYALESIRVEIGYLFESVIITVCTVLLIYLLLRFFGTKVPFKKYVILSAFLQLFVYASGIFDTLFVFVGKSNLTDMFGFIWGLYFFAVITTAQAAMFNLAWWKTLLINIGATIVLLTAAFVWTDIFGITT